MRRCKGRHLRVIADHNQHGLLHRARDRLGNLGMVVAHRSGHCFGDGGLHRHRPVDEFEARYRRLTHAELAPPSERRGLRADCDLGVVADRDIDRVLRCAAHDVRHLGMIVADHIDERAFHRACNDRRAVRDPKAIGRLRAQAKSFPRTLRGERAVRGGEVRLQRRDERRLRGRVLRVRARRAVAAALLRRRSGLARRREASLERGDLARLRRHALRRRVAATGRRCEKLLELCDAKGVHRDERGVRRVRSHALSAGRGLVVAARRRARAAGARATGARPAQRRDGLRLRRKLRFVLLRKELRPQRLLRGVARPLLLRRHQLAIEGRNDGDVLLRETPLARLRALLRRSRLELGEALLACEGRFQLIDLPRARLRRRLERRRPRCCLRLVLLGAALCLVLELLRFALGAVLELGSARREARGTRLEPRAVFRGEPRRGGARRPRRKRDALLRLGAVRGAVDPVAHRPARAPLARLRLRLAQRFAHRVPLQPPERGALLRLDAVHGALDPAAHRRAAALHFPFAR